MRAGHFPLSVALMGAASCSGATPKESSSPSPTSMVAEPSSLEQEETSTRTGHVSSPPEPLSAEEASNQQRENSPHPPQEPEPPPSPFRLVLVDSYGSVVHFKGHRIYQGERGLFDLTEGTVLSACQSPRGYLLKGASLFFAARMSPFSACPDEPYLLEMKAGKWQLRRFIDAHQVLIDEWVGGTTIAAVVPYRSGPPWGYELIRVGGRGAQPPRPQRGKAHPTDPNQNCYSELQRPTSLHAFRSGALMVLGESKCDLGLENDEDPSEEQLRERYRPIVESWKKGHFRSTIVTFPFDEVVSIQETESESLLLLGKTVESFAEGAPFELALYSFDGKAVKLEQHGIKDAHALVLGPENQLWILGAHDLRPLADDRASLTLPPDCESPRAWFEADQAWLHCEEGLYTTDAEQERITLPESAEAQSCEALQPRPHFAVRGLYQMGSDHGGCSARRRLAPSSGKKKQGRPIPRRVSPPADLKLELNDWDF